VFEQTIALIVQQEETFNNSETHQSLCLLPIINWNYEKCIPDGNTIVLHPKTSGQDYYRTSGIFKGH